MKRWMCTHPFAVTSTPRPNHRLASETDNDRTRPGRDVQHFFSSLCLARTCSQPTRSACDPNITTACTVLPSRASIYAEFTSLWDSYEPKIAETAWPFKGDRKYLCFGSAMLRLTISSRFPKGVLTSTENHSHQIHSNVWRHLMYSDWYFWVECNLYIYMELFVDFTLDVLNLFEMRGCSILKQLITDVD